ncbi:xylulokinase [Halotalea alkalilenta]|uniref:Xylulose kinase n=1 Tax=Halotalea alkalilenta TaxID=376489 RepID=A0A172YIR6_9GAMM|nr:xylulokinase [Halotalea alkalilenta]ANF59108.1 xylulokinase [Halotalea alkalilenta]
MYIGVDCGTQSTKVVVLDGERLEILGEAARPHSMIQGDHGRREQDPDEWVSAFEAALAEALERAGVDGSAVRAIGVSGQQHGMVALDAEGRPVHPGKLWCDTESVRENDALIEALGGERGCLERLGLVLQTGYTASKVAWLRKHHYDAYARIETLLLPHDYLNYYLTGERVAEYGDASGTGYFDTRERCWSLDTFALIAPELDPDRVLPRLIEPDAPAGRLRPEIARRLGLGPQVVVSSGGGDNMMGAIGTGNIVPGTMTISLGTSGTLYAASEHPAISSNGLVANFCSSHGGWLPLICTMNVTSATTLVRELLGYDIERFNAAAIDAPVGAGGITVLPFFNGERVPPLPEAMATFEGLGSHNFTPANLCRAVMEGATFGLRYGFDELSRLTGHPSRVRLVGGGAKSAVWRQMVSDVMDVELACPEIGEAAALGAALQAIWYERRQAGESLILESLCERAVGLREETLTRPDAGRVAGYAEAYARYLEILGQRYPATRAE